MVSKSNVTKATDIPLEVKKIVLERDKECCIFCGKVVGMECASAHIVPRSDLGLGIEQNIITACPRCHRKLDQSLSREVMLEVARNYIASIYGYWREYRYDKYKYLKGERE